VAQMPPNAPSHLEGEQMTEASLEKQEPRRRRRGPSDRAIRAALAAGGEIVFSNGAVIRPASSSDGESVNPWDAELQAAE
jgi:hypothetical protein